MQQSEADLADLVRRKQPEVIYHLAAQSNPQASLSDSRATWTLNFWGSFNLLEAVKASGQTPRVVLVSSGVCYGNPPPELIPVKEDCPLRPTTPYAASKAAVDLLGIQHYLTHGTAVVIVRPFNHAGPRQSPTYVLAALASQVADVEAGRLDRLEVGNLDVIRDFTDVRDVVRAYRLLATSGSPGEVYNLGKRRRNANRGCPRIPAVAGQRPDRDSRRPCASTTGRSAHARRGRLEAAVARRLGTAVFDRADACRHAGVCPQGSALNGRSPTQALVNPARGCSAIAAGQRQTSSRRRARSRLRHGRREAGRRSSPGKGPVQCPACRTGSLLRSAATCRSR